MVVAFECPMESILTLLRRLWQPNHLDAENITLVPEERDRSSMADFVRILQDEDQSDPSGQE
jgi:hypothetical protein